MMIRSLLAAGVSTVAAIGCGVEDRVFNLPPAVCFETVDSQTVAINAEFDCIAGGCTDVVGSECSVDRVGNDITITASARTETRRQLTGACTDDCISTLPPCGTLQLEPGEYRLLIGNGDQQQVRALVLEADADAFGCVRLDTERDLQLRPARECVGRPYDSDQACFQAEELLGTLTYDQEDIFPDEPYYLADPVDGTCYQFPTNGCAPLDFRFLEQCLPPTVTPDLCASE